MQRDPKFASIGLVEIGEELAHLRREGKTEDAEGLVGRWFHSYKDGEIAWQGQIISRVGEDLYLVQLYEWLMGYASDQKIVPLADMLDWSFYNSNDGMDDAYERRPKKHG